MPWLKVKAPPPRVRLLPEPLIGPLTGALNVALWPVACSTVLPVRKVARVEAKTPGSATAPVNPSTGTMPVPL